MKVSVLIPYYNDEKYLKTTIDSVLAQTFTDFELILINHATTDSCREIAHSYTDPRIIHMDMEKNYGAGTGLVLERCLKIVRGEYIKLFCADDRMYSDCLKDLVEYMDSHPQKDFAFGDVRYIDTNGRSKHKSWFTDRPDFSLQNDEVKCLKLYFNDKSFLPYVGCIIKRDALSSIKIDKSFICYFDVSLWASLLIKGYKIGYIDKCVAGWRIHSDQMSSAEKAQKLLKMSEYEKSKFITLFFELKDKHLFRQVFSTNRFVELYDELNEEDMQFILYYEMLLHNAPTIAEVGYQYLYDLLQDNEKASYLEKRFGFGIKEFRAIYSTVNRGGLPKISTKCLLYLLFKNILKIITFSELRNEKKKRTNM